MMALENVYDEAYMERGLVMITLAPNVIRLSGL